ncbi:MAG: ABC-F family ATP-binding cassette domain-containing protein [Acholeplasmatales bacterium]|nr:ABC-F family ATP-binding cassette domain-containing protein [Acholeplasmatales bacterium]
MNITFDTVSFKYIERPILDKASFSVSDNDKVGVIGVNGTGKTTLLKMIIGEEKPQGGAITISGGARINYLAQDSRFDPNKSLLDIIMEGSTKDNPIKDYEAISILSKMGFNDSSITTRDFSGGQLKRVALAKVLVTPCDFMILDEPTNHLDNNIISFLEKFLIKFKHGLIMVTHDRYFLERICSRMLELDFGKTYLYDANYSKFLELKADRLEREAKAEKRLKSILRTESEWMHRGVEARRTKSKSRIERFKELSKITFNESKSMDINSVSTYLGRKLIEIKNGSKAYGDNVLFNSFNFDLNRQDIIGVVGDNGAGKTTLFKIIMGLESLDSGELILGETLNIGYFSQHMELIDPEIRVIDYIKNDQNLIETLDGTITASEMLERFLFSKDIQYAKVKMLSGGEKRRLQLVHVLMKNPNILLFDEPTNDLDIYTLELLEDYILNFKGPVMVVSHDRYFLDKICNRLLVFNGKTIESSMKSFSEYLDSIEPLKAEPIKNADPIKPKHSSKRLSYMEQKEFDKLEARISEMDLRMSFLKSELKNSKNDYVKLMDYQKELDSMSEEYDEASLRYLELLEKVEN